VAAAALAFLTLGSEISEGEFTAFDTHILTALRQSGQHIARGPGWLPGAMRDITSLGGVTVVLLIVAVSVIVLLLHDKRREALVLAGTTTFAQILSSLFKLFYDRTRPDFSIFGDLPASHSFPSGHSTVSSATYLLLAIIVARFEPTIGIKRTVFILASVLIVAIGISRVYLGVHWPSDVLGGWVLGGGIALLSAQLFLPNPKR
jgi:undecaprenyl-diphosphatase